MTELPESQRNVSDDARPVHRNSTWMMADQVFRQAVGLGFSIWIARQYGPEGFGTLSFALSLCALFGVLAALGLNRILVRELAKPTSLQPRGEILGVAVTLRLIAAVAAALAATLAAGVFDRGAMGIVAVLSLVFLATSFDSIDLYFQSRLESQIVARARVGALLFSSAVKAYLLLKGYSLSVIAWAFLLDAVCSAAALQVALHRAGISLRLGLGNGELAKALFRESGPEVVAGLFAISFMRMDQLMLQAMRGPADVGIMAVSTRLAEAWYFVPAAIVSSTYPLVVRLSQTDMPSALARQQALYRQVVLLSVVAAIGITIVARDLVLLLYGPSYLPAASVLIVQAWCGVFMSLGIASGVWLMAFRQGRLNLYRTCAGAVLNVLLNLFLIPQYGPLGAAWATLAAFAFAYLFFDFLVPDMRDIGRQKVRALACWHRQDS